MCEIAGWEWEGPWAAEDWAYGPDWSMITYPPHPNSLKRGMMDFVRRRRWVRRRRKQAMSGKHVMHPRDFSLFLLLHGFPARGKVRLQTSCMQRLPNILPLDGLARSRDFIRGLMLHSHDACTHTLTRCPLFMCNLRYQIRDCLLVFCSFKFGG